MTDLSKFDPNGAGNPNNNIFGLPTTEEDARLVIISVPWEVTVSYGSGTARVRPKDRLRIHRLRRAAGTPAKR